MHNQDQPCLPLEFAKLFTNYVDLTTEKGKAEAYTQVECVRAVLNLFVIEHDLDVFATGKRQIQPSIGVRA